MVLSTNFNIRLLSSELSKILVLCWISHLSWRKTSCQSLLLTLSLSYLLNPSFRHQTIILQRPFEDISCYQTKQPSRTIRNPSLSQQSRWLKREGVLTGKKSKDLGQLAHWIVPVRSSPRAAVCHPPHTGMQTGTALQARRHPAARENGHMRWHAGSVTPPTWQWLQLLSFCGCAVNLSVSLQSHSAVALFVCVYVSVCSQLSEMLS